MIFLKNLSFKYNEQETNILSNICYTFVDGETYVIRGENGTGKTTLIKLLLEMLPPSSGEIIKDKRYSISYLPDYNGIYENLTLLENLKFRIGIYNQSYLLLKPTIQEWLERFHLKKYEHTLVKELSLGTKKKVALLCVCVTSPQLLVLDEPTGGLDSESRNELAYMLKEIRNDDMLTICITHDEDLIQQMNGIVLILKERSLINEKI